jgi:hypothetical protein
MYTKRQCLNPKDFLSFALHSFPKNSIYDVFRKVTGFVEVEDVKIGLEIGDIRKKSSHSFIGNTVVVFSLERLLDVSFEIQWLDS